MKYHITPLNTYPDQPLGGGGPEEEVHPAPGQRHVQDAARGGEPSKPRGQQLVLGGQEGQGMCINVQM